MISGASIPRLIAGVQGSRLGNEFIVLDAPGRVLRGINATGERVFGLCDGRRNVDDIATLIAQEYGADARQVLADVTAFLSMLAERGLIECLKAQDDAARQEQP